VGLSTSRSDHPLPQGRYLVLIYVRGPSGINKGAKFIEYLKYYGTIGQKWPQYKGLSPTPLAIKENLEYCIFWSYSSEYAIFIQISFSYEIHEHS
jgi:hypothetical protein